MTLALVLGAAVGILLGILGGGGSLIAVPLLTFFLGLDTAEAVPAALLGVGLAALAASVPHARRGDVDVRTALPFLLIGSAASALGARAGLATADAARQLLFAAVAAAAAVRLLRPVSHRPARPSWGRIAASATVAGFLTGFLGVGGGFLIVPALTLAAGLPMRRAVGTSTVILGVTALAGFATHQAMGARLSPLAPYFIVPALLAAPAASLLSARLPQAGLKRAFAGLLFLVSAVSLWKIV